MIQHTQEVFISTTQLLKKIRTVTVTHLPIGNSLLPFDLLIHVIHADLIGDLLTVKKLFNSLPYSDMGTRYHFNRLVKEQWIDLVVSKTDSRSKHCKPSTKLKIQYKSIVNLLSD